MDQRGHLNKNLRLDQGIINFCYKLLLTVFNWKNRDLVNAWAAQSNFASITPYWLSVGPLECPTDCLSECLIYNAS